jgi:hypothetical protein
MALGDRVDELSKLAATLTERVDNVRADLAKVDAAQSQVDASFAQIQSQLAVVEE